MLWFHVRNHWPWDMNTRLTAMMYSRLETNQEINMYLSSSVLVLLVKATSDSYRWGQGNDLLPATTNQSINKHKTEWAPWIGETSIFLERQACLILPKTGGSHANEWEMIVIDQKQKLELVIISDCSVSCLQIGSFLRGELSGYMWVGPGKWC